MYEYYVSHCAALRAYEKVALGGVGGGRVAARRADGGPQRRAALSDRLDDVCACRWRTVYELNSCGSAQCTCTLTLRLEVLPLEEERAAPVDDLVAHDREAVHVAAQRAHVLDAQQLRRRPQLPCRCEKQSKRSAITQNRTRLFSSPTTSAQILPLRSTRLH